MTRRKPARGDGDGCGAGQPEPLRETERGATYRGSPRDTGSEGARRAGRGSRRSAPRRHDDRRRRLRPVWHSREPDTAGCRQRHTRPDDHRQQRRRGRLWDGSPAPGTAGAPDRCFVCRREQGIRAPGARRRHRARAGAAGHAGGAATGGGRGHTGVLHPNRGRHDPWRRQRDANVRRQRVCPPDGHPGRPLAGESLDRRRRRKPGLPAHRPQLQPRHRDLWRDHGRGGRAPRGNR